MWDSTMRLLGIGSMGMVVRVQMLRWWMKEWS
jgi:hypothetical protein